MKKSIPAILVLIFGIMTSCMQYEQVAINKNTIPEQGYYFIIHQKQQQWFMYNASAKNDTVSGTICSVVDKSLKANFVHLYVSSELILPEEEHAPMYIPYAQIYTAEINRNDKFKTNTLSVSAAGFYLILSALAFAFMIFI